MRKFEMISDTSPEITQKMCEMILKKTPLERFKMGCSMYETSKILITRSIFQNNPEITESNLRMEFFLRFYGNDFDPITKKKILNHLKKVS